VFAPFGANTHPVPTISRFYGIDIFMWFNDHEPPHFHARYGAYEAKIAIESGEVLSGELPGRALKLVRKWQSVSKPALMRNWVRARDQQPLEGIEPLR
jgi:hypothetical protein